MPERPGPTWRRERPPTGEAEAHQPFSRRHARLLIGRWLPVTIDRWLRFRVLDPVRAEGDEIAGDGTPHAAFFSLASISVTNDRKYSSCDRWSAVSGPVTPETAL